MKHQSHRAPSRLPACAAFLLACAALPSVYATPPPTATPAPAPAAATKPAATPAPAAAPAAKPAAVVAPATAPAPAAAPITSAPTAAKPAGPSVLGTDPLKPGEFAWQPQFSTAGPLLVVVNISEQMAYVYRNGLRIGRSSVSTGKPGHETPTGVFTILEKHEEHYSNKYNNAPMPFMQRLTWDGVALHAGKIPGYPASHGCVRLPYQFSQLLFGATNKGVTVVIANDTPTPTMVGESLIAPTTLSAQVEAAWAGASTWNPSLAPEGPVTIILSTKEQIAHVLRNGTEIGRVRVAMDGPAPSGTTAYVLLEGETGEESKILPGKPALRWQVVGDGTGEEIVPLAGDFAAQMHIPPSFAEKVYAILEPGAAVVITNEVLSRQDKLASLTVLRADEGVALEEGVPEE